MRKVTKKDLIEFMKSHAEMSIEIMKLVSMNKQSIIKLENEQEQPKLKQLDQSIFDGLDAKWRFAAVCSSGKAIAAKDRPEPLTFGYFIKDGFLLVGTGYDTTDWQDSLIERDIAKELLEVDLSSELTGSELCKAMLARGDKYISGFGHHHSDALALQSKFADTVSKHTQCFQSSQNAWDYFVPINSQGEPLTAADVGL